MTALDKMNPMPFCVKRNGLDDLYPIRKGERQLMAKHACKSKHAMNKTKYGNPMKLMRKSTSKHGSGDMLAVKALDATGRKAIPFMLIGVMTAGSAVIAGNIDYTNPMKTKSVQPIAGYDVSTAASRSSSRDVLTEKNNGVETDGSAMSVTSEENVSWGGVESLDVPETKSARERTIENIANRNKDKQAIVDKAVAYKPDAPTWLGVNGIPLTLDNAEAMLAYNAASKPSGWNANHDTGDSGNAYSFSQCTWWTYVRRHQLGLPAGSHMGDGRMWYDSGNSLGYWTSIGNPLPGDILSFPAGSYGSDGYYGHVAVVEYVSPNGDIITSESGASYDGQYFSRVFPASLVKNMRFVHL